MYIVTATNFVNTVTFEEYYLERKLAFDMFNTATKCVDCEQAMIISATTGEVLAEYISGKEIRLY